MLVAKMVREIGPHAHEWKLVGVDASGEKYEQCELCGTRRCLYRPRFDAYRQDWLNYHEDWEPEAAAEMEVEEIEVPKRKPGRPRKNT